MAYREHPAPLLLRGWVECGWSAAIDPDEPPRTHGVLPDGCMDLIWTGDELLVAGPDTSAAPVRREPGVVVRGLRFAPGRLPALLDVPAAALRDLRVPLAELHPALARRATARLRHGDTAADVLADVALALPGPAPDPAMAAALAHLGAGTSVTDTADALGWTTRSLHRRCLTAFGYGPVVLRRVLRFRRAVALLGAGTPAAEVAARAGYADQPHLSREVRALGGVAPSQLVDSRLAPLLTR